MSNLFRSFKASLILIAITAILLGLAACKPQETELSFETIEQKNDPSSIRQWESRASKLLIISSSQDVEEGSRFVTDEALAALQKMDFATQFAVLAFRGLQGSSHAGFKIERIIRQDNEIVLYAQPGFIGPAPEVSSPYHLIKVNKEGNWDGNFTFNLYFDRAGVAAASTTHHVP